MSKRNSEVNSLITSEDEMRRHLSLVKSQTSTMDDKTMNLNGERRKIFEEMSKQVVEESLKSKLLP